MTKPDLMAELAAQSKWLRKAAAEIAAAGHTGWGNTCLQAAEKIDTHHAELEAAVRDAEALRRVKAMRDEWERDEREHLATFGQHLPASVICMVEKLDAAMHNSAREGTPG